jgi:DNA repair protein RecO (recombination protein O)
MRRWGHSPCSRSAVAGNALGEVVIREAGDCWTTPDPCLFSGMPLLATDAVVLHVADYLESSRILRLATRECGVQTVVARGARNSKKRFGAAVDLFARGNAQVEIRPGRDMHTLISFDVTTSHPELAGEMARFSAASAIAECVMRVVHEELAPTVYEGLIDAFERLSVSNAHEAAPEALGALWRLTRDVGFAPSLDLCGNCHQPVAAAVDASFSHVMGGVLCQHCATRAPGGRRLPAAARATIVGWLNHTTTELSQSDVRAHQRLLREFVAHHMTDGRPLRAYASWERGGLDRIG